MSRRSHGHDTASLIHEAARIICEEAVTDYRTAKRKAAERLGISNGALPDNAQIEAEVISWQQLYGGDAYHERLAQMRQTAVQAMRLLKSFDPRLVGGAVSGAISNAHRVQLHAYGDKAEMLEVFLLERGIPCEQGERDYRYADGSQDSVPLVRFEAGEIGIDVAVFTPEDARRAVLSPIDGQPMRRLSLAQAEALAGRTQA